MHKEALEIMLKYECKFGQKFERDLHNGVKYCLHCDLITFVPDDQEKYYDSPDYVYLWPRGKVFDPNERPHLLQEDYIKQEDGPWKILVVCLLLNQTTWKQAEPVLEKLFEKWPKPSNYLNFTSEDRENLEVMLKPLGLMNLRAKRLTALSREYAEYESRIANSAANGLTTVNWSLQVMPGFTGCGPYAKDAWDLFVRKKKCKPLDRVLRKYAEKVDMYG